MQFSNLYEGAIDASEKSPVPAKRIASIIDHLTYQVYSYCQRGLFGRHKLIFALMLTMRILTAMGKVKVSPPFFGHGSPQRQQPPSPLSIPVLDTSSSTYPTPTPSLPHSTPPEF